MYNNTEGIYCLVSAATTVTQHTTMLQIHWLPCFSQTDQLQLNNSTCLISKTEETRQKMCVKH